MKNETDENKTFRVVGQQRFSGRKYAIYACRKCGHLKYVKYEYGQAPAPVKCERCEELGVSE